MIRGTKSKFGRAALHVVLFLVAVLAMMLPVGLLGSSNLVWGEDNQYGRVTVPGTAELHLPAGETRVSVAVRVPGRGNQTPDLPFPDDLTLKVTPLGGAGQPVVTQVKDAGSSNADDNAVNTQREAWTVQVPADGLYRVSAEGDFDGIGTKPQLWFGHGPPLPGTYVPAVAAGLVVVCYVVWYFFIRGRPRSEPQPKGVRAGLSTWRRPRS